MSLTQGIDPELGELRAALVQAQSIKAMVESSVAYWRETVATAEGEKYGRLPEVRMLRKRTREAVAQLEQLDKAIAGLEIEILNIQAKLTTRPPNLILLTNTELH